ncbi:hypothetical protein [Streptomyces finlayi]|uniref:hypothetical protein n=1 Tax=Streptomyces finlayi TaxID=67296 RepID=UPI0035BC7BFE
MEPLSCRLPIVLLIRGLFELRHSTTGHQRPDAQAQPADWDSRDGVPTSYYAAQPPYGRMLPGIGGLRLDVTKVLAKFEYDDHKPVDQRTHTTRRSPNAAPRTAHRTELLPR